MLFVIYALDRPNSAQKRADTRPAHLDYLKTKADKILAAGPLMSDDQKSSIGSLLIVDAADLDEVKKTLGGDPYVQADLFETIDVHPYRLVMSGQSS